MHPPPSMRSTSRPVCMHTTSAAAENRKALASPAPHTLREKYKWKNTSACTPCPPHRPGKCKWTNTRAEAHETNIPARLPSRPTCMHITSTASESREALAPPALRKRRDICKWKNTSAKSHKKTPRARPPVPLICIPQAPTPREEKRLHPLPTTHSGRNVNGKVQAREHKESPRARPPVPLLCIPKAPPPQREALAPPGSHTCREKC